MVLAHRSAAGGILFELKSWARFILPSKYFAVFYPSSLSTVERMLNLTECGPKDTLFDLGAGDGRVLIAAAQRGAKAIGYELDAELVATARQAISQHPGAARLCQVLQGDASTADVSSATIIALYLSDQGNTRLMKALQPSLRPGTKVVSNFFPIAGWDQHLLKTCFADPSTGPLHLYQVPKH
mmetsp:Transcript_8251/g.22021  ORF Transcript_8251/g.22021 Transcript_8251/m.22021 type:complete len:183 (+) Transcript_8251:3470-4018(+)